MKNCLICDKEHNNKKYCSRGCYYESIPDRKGKSLNTGKTHFKKGHVPWNKGLKGDKRLGGPPKGHKSYLPKDFAPWNKGKKYSLYSEDEKDRISERQRGKNNSNWNGGTSSERQKAIGSRDYALWRTAVFMRDNHTCQECGERSRKGKRVTLNADHIKPWATHPELRYAIDNGRTLCVECHRQTDTYAKTTKYYLNKQAQYTD